jgi:hypothetical protein
MNVYTICGPLVDDETNHLELSTAAAVERIDELCIDKPELLADHWIIDDYGHHYNYKGEMIK